MTDSSLQSCNWPLSRLQITKIQFYRLQVFWKAISNLQESWFLQFSRLQSWLFQFTRLENSQIQFTGKSITPPLFNMIPLLLPMYLMWLVILAWWVIQTSVHSVCLIDVQGIGIVNCSYPASNAGYFQGPKVLIVQWIGVKNRAYCSLLAGSTKTCVVLGWVIEFEICFLTIFNTGSLRPSPGV